MTPRANAGRLLAASLALLLVGGSAAYAAPPSPPAGPATYSANLLTGGTISNAGNATYKVEANQLAFAMVDGYTLNPETATVHYTLNAEINGLSTDGKANVQVTGTVGEPLSLDPTWASSCSSGSDCGTFSTGPAPPAKGPAADQLQGCKNPGPDGSYQCKAQFTPSTDGVIVVTAGYPIGDSYNSPSSDSYTLYVGDTGSSLATGTSVACDHAFLSAGQTTNCKATVTTADSSPENGDVTWGVACSQGADCGPCTSGSSCGTFSTGPAPPAGKDGSTTPQSCKPSDHDGKMQCQVKFTVADGATGPILVSMTYAPVAGDQHSPSTDSFTLFVGTSPLSTATSTSLTCDQYRIKSSQDAKCTATIYASGGQSTVKLTADLSMDSQTTAVANVVGLGGQPPMGFGIPMGCGLASCNSFIPGFFAAAGNVQVTVGNGPKAPPAPGGPKAQPQTEMFLESAYLNPWGGPILIESADGSIVIAVVYNVGTINWTGSQVVGTMSGALGDGSPVSGTVTITTNELENLFTGVHSDTGTMTFSDFASSLSTTPMEFSGHFSGTSIIPDPNAPVGSDAYNACLLENAVFGSTPMQVGFTTPCTNDCSAMLGFPGLGVCTETGFQSTGQFNLKTQPSKPAPGQGPEPQYALAGTFSTTWAVPAIGFVSTASATITQH